MIQNFWKIKGVYYEKIITMLSLVVMSTILIVGCSSSKNSDSLYLGNCTDNMIGMGKKGYEFIVIAFQNK